MTIRMKSTLISTTTPTGTAISTGSGTPGLLRSSTISIGVTLLELEVVGSLDIMAVRISVGEESEGNVTLGVMVGP